MVADHDAAEYLVLVDTFTKSDIEFLRVKTDSFELVLSRSDDYVTPAGGPPVEALAPRQDAAARVRTEQPPVAPADPGVSTPSTVTQPPAPSPAPAGVARQNAVVVPAPSVGVAYLAPSPGEPPYVEVGSTVEPGATIALVEAMKVFTAVSADLAGTIVEVLVENNTFVEYGQPLFAIMPASEGA